MSRRKHHQHPQKNHPQREGVQPFALSENDRLRPWLLAGFTSLVVARPLFPSESAATYGDGMPMVMLWITLAVLWLLGAIGRPKFSIRFGWIDAAVLLLVGWHTLAALWAVWHGSPRPALNMLWEWVGLGLCFFLARQFIVTPTEVRAVVAVMIALAVALAGYGLYQCFHEMPATRAIYESDPDAAIRNAGLWFPPGSPERQLFADRLYSTEPMATFALTNSLAGYLVPWLVILAGMICASISIRRQLWKLVLCAMPIAACLLLTKSRSGYVAVGVGVVVAWLASRLKRTTIGWKWPTIVTVVLVAMITAGISFGGLDREVLSQASKSFGYRLQYWQSTGQIIAEHPILGCGPGNFQDTYPRYKLPEASEEVADPHNFLLEIWATAGTPAAIAFLMVLGCFVWTIARDANTIGKEPKCGEVVKDEKRELPKPLIINSTSIVSHPNYILSGCFTGFLLSFPMGLLSVAPQGIAALLLGLPIAALALLLLRGWIQEGQMPRWLPAVGVAALLINLLAAGGIGLPSVAGTLWLLLAVGLPEERPRELPTRMAWVMLLLTILLAYACYRTAYSRVLDCHAQLRLSERKPAQAAEYLEAAAAADPLSAEPRRRLADLEFDRWRQEPNEESFRRFEAANENVLTLSPGSPPAWFNAAERYCEAYSKTGSRHALEVAIHDYQRAIELYPNNALYRAKLADAALAAGNHAIFRSEAEAALNLDAATPHKDRKLPTQTREHLQKVLRDNP